MKSPTTTFPGDTKFETFLLSKTPKVHVLMCMKLSVIQRFNSLNQELGILNDQFFLYFPLTLKAQWYWITGKLCSFSRTTACSHLLRRITHSTVLRSLSLGFPEVLMQLLGGPRTPHLVTLLHYFLHCLTLLTFHSTLCSYPCVLMHQTQHDC